MYYHFDPQGKSEDAKRATLITTTLLLVLFSIMVCGALTKPLLDFMLGPDGERTAECSYWVWTVYIHAQPGSCRVNSAAGSWASLPFPGTLIVVCLYVCSLSLLCSYEYYGTAAL